MASTSKAGPNGIQEPETSTGLPRGRQQPRTWASLHCLSSRELYQRQAASTQTGALTWDVGILSGGLTLRTTMPALRTPPSTPPPRLCEILLGLQLPCRPGSVISSPLQAVSSFCSHFLIPDMFFSPAICGLIFQSHSPQMPIPRILNKSPRQFI